MEGTGETDGTLPNDLENLGFSEEWCALTRHGGELPTFWFPPQADSIQLS
jgi:hypothetical protein